MSDARINEQSADVSGSDSGEPRRTSAGYAEGRLQLFVFFKPGIVIVIEIDSPPVCLPAGKIAAAHGVQPFGQRVPVVMPVHRKLGAVGIQHRNYEHAPHPEQKRSVDTGNRPAGFCRTAVLGGIFHENERCYRLKSVVRADKKHVFLSLADRDQRNAPPDEAPSYRRDSDKTVFFRKRGNVRAKSFICVTHNRQFLSLSTALYIRPGMFL